MKPIKQDTYEAKNRPGMTNLSYACYGALEVERVLFTLLKTLVLSFIFSFYSHGDSIKWLLSDWPPYQYQQDGQYLGYSVDTLKVVLKYLTQHDHHFQISNYKRRHSKFKHKEKVCTFGISKNAEREEYMHFSIPAELYFPIQIFMRQNTYENLGKPKLTSLEELLRNNAGTLAITPGVIYSPRVDELINNEDFKNSIFINTTKAISKNLYGMLLLGRVDFLLDWPPEGRYGLNLQKAEGQVVSVILKEASEMSLAYAACPKTEWGRKMILQINHALARAHKDSTYTHAYQAFLDAYLVNVYVEEFKRRILNKGE